MKEFSLQNYIPTYFEKYKQLLYEQISLVSWLSNSTYQLVSKGLGQKIFKIMCFSFQVRFLLNCVSYTDCMGESKSCVGRVGL